ncbi:MAG TPA: DUF1646 family protein [Candidatus Binataceae bacterium]|nr:DUF1646 family protein [Candidatus Binataceae bacterium]
MHHAAAIIILSLLVFGPVLTIRIERNLELYCLSLGVLATIIGPGFTVPLIISAMRVPAGICAAVIAAAVVFGLVRADLDAAIRVLEMRVPRPALTAAAIFAIAALASVVTVIVGALLLVEVIAILRFDDERRVRVTVAGCFAIGMGSALTPLGGPLATLAAHGLKMDFFGLMYLLAPWVIPGVIAASIAAGVFARGGKMLPREGTLVFRSNRDIIVQACKVFAFIAGLVLISNAYGELVGVMVARFSNAALYVGNTVSMALENSTLVALEIHNMNPSRARMAIISLLVSGGILIPGNIANIISAGSLRIRSGEWARTGVPMGIALLSVYFVLLQIFG